MYITSPDQLKEFCESLKSSDVLAVDTEFVREKTYFHRIGLIQVAGKNGCAAIDPILLNDLTKKGNYLKTKKRIQQNPKASKRQHSRCLSPCVWITFNQTLPSKC